MSAQEGIRLEHDWFPRALPGNVIIGKRSWCYSAFAFLHYQSRRPTGASIGHDTGIYNGTFFDLGPEGEVEIGNFCTLVGAIISTNSRVAIGDYSFIAHEVVLADSPFASPRPRHAEPDPSASASLPIILGANCWIGARAVLLGGATIGEGAVIGAGSIVTGPIPPYCIAAGNPARIVKHRLDS